MIIDIGNIYKPPDMDIVKFNDSMSKVLDRINKEGNKCHILGDFNINLCKRDNHQEKKC